MPIRDVSSSNRPRALAADVGASAAGDPAAELAALEDRFDGHAATQTGERLLKELGFGPGTVDTNYSAKTAEAVKSFQQAVGMHPTGALDTRTLHAMRDAARQKHHHVQAPGQKSAAIAKTERQLKGLGFKPGPADGVYDKETASAVRAFKRDAKIGGPRASRGLLGANGRKQLEGARKGMKRTEQMLKDLGLHPGGIDGKYTRNTQRAVDRFRRHHHSGHVGAGTGPGTMRSIRKAWKAKMAPRTNTVKGCAQFLLRSHNVSFWSGLSSGSDRRNMQRLARGEKAFVPATGGHVKPKLSLMKALVDMAKHGRIQINALTGGTHSTGSNHYRGTAVDLDVNVGNTGEIVHIANRHGGFRNFETSHIHLDF